MKKTMFHEKCSFSNIMLHMYVKYKRLPINYRMWIHLHDNKDMNAV